MGVQLGIYFLLDIFPIKNIISKGCICVFLGLFAHTGFSYLVLSSLIAIEEGNISIETAMMHPVNIFLLISFPTIYNEHLI